MNNTWFWEVEPRSQKVWALEKRSELNQEIALHLSAAAVRRLMAHSLFFSIRRNTVAKTQLNCIKTAMAWEYYYCLPQYQMAFLPIYLVLWRTCGLKIKPNFSSHGVSQNSRILQACLYGFLWTWCRSDLSIICEPICPMEQILQKAKKTLELGSILPSIKTFL